MRLGRPFYLAFMAVVYLHTALAMATTGDTAQDDIAREFSGSPRPINDGAAPPPPPAGCNTTLQEEESSGEIPAGEQCYCPSGATQPVCVLSNSSLCEANLAMEEQSMGSNAQYYDCTCPSGASTPSCVSYYQLCEENLPYYQSDTNQCSCSTSATSAVPSCVSDYQICEENAAQYENGSTTCSCSSTSTQPTCCTQTTVATVTDVPGIAVNPVAGTGVGAIYCANTAMAVENTAQGDTCPASGVVVCAYAICRIWGADGDFTAGADLSFDKNNPSVTYPAGGSYWDYGYCNGPNPAGDCNGEFTIYEGPSGYTGASIMLYNATYAETTYSTVESCVQE